MRRGVEGPVCCFLREMVCLPRASYGQYHYGVARLMEPMLINTIIPNPGLFSKANPAFASELATCQKVNKGQPA
jgi:hypothetical protein